MSGNSIFETSPTFFTDYFEALRARIGHDRKLLFAAGGIAAALVVATAIIVNAVSGSAGADKTALAATPAKVDIGDPLVILAPSDGRNGTALALAAGKPLFPLSGSGELNYDAAAPIEAQDVKVEQISSNQGFWIGNNDEQRVFVHVGPAAIAKGALNPSALQEGQLVNVSGRMQPVPADPTALGVTDDDTGQLAIQSEFVEANSVRPPT